MANLSGIIKRIVNYDTSDPTNTDYFITDNSDGENKKFSFLRLKQILFAKKTATIETDIGINLLLYRSGGTVFFRIAGYTSKEITITEMQIATIPEGFRPVAQIVRAYVLSISTSYGIYLRITSTGEVFIKGSKILDSGTAINIMECYIYAGSYPTD